MNIFPIVLSKSLTAHTVLFILFHGLCGITKSAATLCSRSGCMSVKKVVIYIKCNLWRVLLFLQDTNHIQFIQSHATSVSELLSACGCCPSKGVVGDLGSASSLCSMDLLRPQVMYGDICLCAPLHTETGVVSCCAGTFVLIWRGACLYPFHLKWEQSRGRHAAWTQQKQYHFNSYRSLWRQYLILFFFFLQWGFCLENTSSDYHGNIASLESPATGKLLNANRTSLQSGRIWTQCGSGLFFHPLKPCLFLQLLLYSSCKTAWMTTRLWAGGREPIIAVIW